MYLKKKKYNHKLLLIIYAFLSIFNPDFFSIETTNIMFIFGVIYIVWTVIGGSHKLPKQIMKFAIVFIPFILYIITASILHSFFDTHLSGVYFDQVKNNIGIIAKILVIFATIYIYSKRNNITTAEYLDTLLIVGVIQLLCVVSSFFVPAIRDYFNSLTIANSPSEHLVSYVLMNGYRCYGLADNLFDSFGYTTSFLIMIAVIYGIEKQSKYFVIAGAMLFMPLLNSRTGLLLVFVSTIAAFTYLGGKIRINRMIKILFFGFVAVLLFIQLFRFLPDETRKWVERGYKSIILFFNGEKVTTFAAFDSMIGMPPNWLFGMGTSPENLKVGVTDIGYTQCVWRYGVIGTILLLYTYLSSIYRLYIKSNDRIVKCFSITIALIYFIYLYKLFSFGNMCGNFIIFSVYAVFMANQKKV